MSDARLKMSGRHSVTALVADVTGRRPRRVSRRGRSVLAEMARDLRREDGSLHDEPATAEARIIARCPAAAFQPERLA